jgi:hypothetical protein
MAQMTIRIGEPPEQGIFPIWAWYQWSGAKKKPDLRSDLPALFGRVLFFRSRFLIKIIMY